VLFFADDKKSFEGGGEIQWLDLRRWWCYSWVFDVVNAIFG